MGEIPCCSKQTLLVTVSTWLVLSFGLIVFILFCVLNQEENFLFGIPPDGVYFSLLGLFGLWLLLSLSGFVGRVLQKEAAIQFFIVVGAVNIFVTIGVFLYVLLFANDIATVGALDDLAAESAANIGNKVIVAIETNPKGFQKLQNDFDCCGFDFQSLVAIGYANFTGAVCKTAPLKNITCAGIEDIKACEASEMARLSIPSTFFCKDAFLGFFKDQTPAIGGIMGVVVLIQLVAWFAACRMYWVPYDLGGFGGSSSGDDGSMSADKIAASQNYGFQQSQDFDLNQSRFAGSPGFGNDRPMSSFGMMVQRAGNRMSSKFVGRHGQVGQQTPSWQ